MSIIFPVSPIKFDLLLSLTQRLKSYFSAHPELFGWRKSHSDLKASNLSVRCVNTMILERYIDSNSLFLILCDNS